MPAKVRHLRGFEEERQRRAAHRPEAADLLVSYLEQLEVRYVFGVPGGAIEPFYNALARSARRGGPRPVLARHETGAAYMADAYARESGKMSVCCATSGPGATNLITGVACAYENESPVLVITAQPPLPSLGRRALQDATCSGVNAVAMFEHCTRYNTLVSHGDQLEQKLVHAIARAHQSPRGPVHLSIPVDVLRSHARPATPSFMLPPMLRRAPLTDVEAVQALSDMVRSAKRIAVVVGAGCTEGMGQVLEFAALTNASLIASPDGKGLINSDHPLFCGIFGFAGHAGARETLVDEQLDLVLAVGMGLGELTSSGWSDLLLNSRLVHIDPTEEHLSRSPMAKLHVRGSVSSVFGLLAARLQETGRPIQVSPPPSRRWAVDEPGKYVSDEAPIKPQRLMRELGERFPASALFMADAGCSLAWSVHYLPLPGGEREAQEANPGMLTRSRYRISMDFAPMAWTIGASIGTAMASPDRPVVAITGDGSFLMSGQEITVAVVEELTVIFVILNDSSLGMVKHGQRLAGAECVAFELPPVDFAAMARAMGAQAHTIRTPEDLAALDIDAICSHRGPTLLDVHVDPEETPPMGVRIETLGSAK